MTVGNGSISVQTNDSSESGSPFSANSAHNGTSIDADGKVVLGDPGDNAAALQDSRTIPLNGNTLQVMDESSTQTFQNTGDDITSNDGTYPKRMFQQGDLIESGWYHDLDQSRTILFIQNSPR